EVVLGKWIVATLFEHSVADLGATLQLLDEWKTIAHGDTSSRQSEACRSSLLHIADIASRSGVHAACHRHVQSRRDMAVKESETVLLSALHSESGLDRQATRERYDNEHLGRNGRAGADELERGLMKIYVESTAGPVDMRADAPTGYPELTPPWTPSPRLISTNRPPETQEQRILIARHDRIRSA